MSTKHMNNSEKIDISNQRSKYNNLNKIKFSLSVSPSFSRSNFELLTSDNFVDRLKRNSDKIFDLIFTCHIPPFMQDAHGVFLTKTENEMHLRHMVELQEKTDIMVSPVFNNIYVPNTYENLKLFVESFKPLYDMGVRSMTMPHLLWLKMGILQKTFPDLYIKNTVLRRVRNGQDFWNYAEAGVDYINLDRILVRDRQTLKEIYAAQQKFKEKTGKHVYTSMLSGEGCFGYCPLPEEHHQHTLTHPDVNENMNKNLEIFRLPQELYCLTLGDHFFNPLFSVGLPAFKEDLDEICQYFDVIKLVGRRAFMSVVDNLQKIESFITSEEPFSFDVPEIIKTLHQNPENYGKLLSSWRKRIRNCRFQCWNCDICSDIVALAMPEMSNKHGNITC